MSIPDRRWASVNEAGEYAGCSHKTIRNFIARGLVPAYRFGTKAIRVDLNDIDILLELERIPTAGDASSVAGQ